MIIRTARIILYLVSSCHCLTHQFPLLIQDQTLSLDEFNTESIHTDNPTVRLPDTWEVLGPFPHGAREVGVDPLSAYGGFEHLNYSDIQRFPSELADGGFVKWRRVQTNADQSVGPIDYPNVRWEFNQQPFGWTILHHATYFRGEFEIPVSGVYLVTISNVVSYKIDDSAFVGNVYGYEHASESAIYLTKGIHKIFVCLVLDVRSAGGQIPPRVSFKGSISFVDLESDTHGIVSFPKDTIIPDLLDGNLMTPFISITVLNADVVPRVSIPTDSENDTHAFHFPHHGNGAGWVSVLSVDVFDAISNARIPAEIPVLYTITLAPGHVFPIPIQIKPPFDNFPSSIRFEIRFKKLDTNNAFNVETVPVRLRNRAFGEVFKYTFLGYDTFVQYAMAKPPIKPCVRSDKIKCPIVLALHGAGVDAESQFWTEAVRRQDYAWVVFPTGRTPWGFDWHGPSLANAEQAMDSIQLLTGISHFDGMKADSNRVIVVGHSNGGQGAWWFASHYPDRVLAVVAASGYIKIQLYVPYYMHVGYAYTDPVLRALLEASIAENDLDLYIGNVAGIPVFARTGSDDTNVPPLHTRRLIRMLNEWNRNPEYANVSEVPNQGHWFDNVLSDDSVETFLRQTLDISLNPTLKLPPLPDAFTITTMNPASTGSKGGIRILQLEVPFRRATIRVHRYGNTWMLNTTNVRRFGFFKDPRQIGIDSWSIDGTEFFTSPVDAGPSYVREGAEWELASDLLWISRERHPSTYGPIPLIFSHPFRIVIPTETNHSQVYMRVAQHLLSSWYLHARGGSLIVRDVDVLDGLAAQFNLIVLGGPKENLYTRRREKEGSAKLLQFLPSGGIQIHSRKYESPGTGVLFLAPSPARTRMGLFVAGVDNEGFQRAAWSIPFRTGLEMPDYIVVGDEFGDPATGWSAGNGSPFGGAGTKGAGGIFAAGFWNNTWEYDDRCGYLK